MNIALEMPEKVLGILQEMARAEDLPLEEVILKILVERANAGDPETKAEMHLKLCEKYLHEGEELLAKEDYVQAGEKGWGAASQMVKAVAARRGEELRSHRELHKFMSLLSQESIELGRLWRSATSLHQNFYENWFVPQQVQEGVEDVRTLVERLRAML